MGIAIGQHLHDSRRLFSDIMSNYSYNKHIVPVLNYSQSLDITIHSYLYYIKSFREVDETILVSMTLILDWNDASLQWNPRDYGGIRRINVPADEIWSPPIILGNTASDMETIGRNHGLYARVSYNGLVSVRQVGMLEAICPSDVSKFPFDTQTCIFIFITKGYSSSEVSLKTTTEYVGGSFYTAHPDWVILSNKTVITNETANTYRYRNFLVELKFRRHPTYHFTVIIVPTMMFCLMNPLVFLLPVESGERISLAMTILLSYVVFLSLVSASIPAKSDPMCYLLVTMIAVILISGVIVGMAIVSSVFYYRDIQEPDVSNPNSTVIGKSKRQQLIGKQMSRKLDKTFCLISYVLFFSSIITYFMVIGQ